MVLPASHQACFLIAEVEGKVYDQETSALDLAAEVFVHSSHSYMAVQGHCHSFDHRGGLPSAWEEADACPYSIEMSCSDFYHPSSAVYHNPWFAIFPVADPRKCLRRQHSAEDDFEVVVEVHDSAVDAGYNTDLADCSLPCSMKR